MAAGWVFAPVLGSPLAHAPVLRYDLLPQLRRPISRGLFGENKTWRGALVMTGGPIVAAVALDRIDAYRERLPPEIREAGPVRVGATLGAAWSLGELPNSFVKRRLGIAPGRQRRSPAGAAISLWDQGDWVPVAALMLRPTWRMTARETAATFALVVAIHLPINVVGYAIGARTSPL